MKKNNKNAHILLSENLPNLTAPDLWDRIAIWRDALVADKPLTARLKTEVSVSDDELGDLVLEYLRFTYLAWTMPSGATPSIVVDEVWHAHLLFTRSYEAYCRATRGEVLHHEPGDGTQGDAARFKQAYENTLARYAAEFGEPPARWWPRPVPPTAAVPSTAGDDMLPGFAGSALIGSLALVGATLLGFVPLGIAVVVGLVFGIGLLATSLVSAATAGQTTGPKKASGNGKSGKSESGGTCSGGGIVPGGDACDPGGGGGDGCGSSCGSSCGSGGCGG